MGGLIDRHRDALPGEARSGAVTLGEGGTPLLRLDNIAREQGLEFELHCKFEGCNPTGSFKDRGMAVAVSAARARGVATVACASTGNTSASAAAYAGLAGMRCVVLMPEGRVAAGKVAQAVMHGADIVQVRGNFDDAMRLVGGLAEQGRVEVVNSTNPMRLQGQKTVAFEVIDGLGRAPDYHALPVGNAGNITAHWIGYSEAAGQSTKACTLCQGAECPLKPKPTAQARPRMVGYQAKGAAPFLRGGFVDEPETVATAIRIGRPQSWDRAWAASRESGGWFGELDDAGILAAQRMLAEREGVFCEPASAAAVAGVLADAKAGRFEKGSCVVCTLTGHGLKDPSVAERHIRSTTIDPTPDALAQAIGEGGASR